jgi:ABC-2 type transport system ATP-binding protein
MKKLNKLINTANPIIILNNITKQFSQTKALDNVTLSVNEGELFGLLGPNGSGKTTMIKVLTGQIKPNSGSATISGIDVVHKALKVRESVGIIPEQENPPSFLTSEEYLYFVCEIRNLDNAKARVEKWLKMLDFADQRNILCKDLSRGTRQKLMFAQAFIHEPKIAFIDEPLVNLDPVSQKKVKDYLKYQVKSGGTIFFSTHTLEIADEICTRIAIIDKGRIIYSGKINDVRKGKETLEDIFIRLLNQDEKKKDEINKDERKK